jgi:hypothetical protein
MNHHQRAEHYQQQALCPDGATTVHLVHLACSGNSQCSQSSFPPNT